MKAEDDRSFVDLGVRASTFSEYLARSGFRVTAGRE
jgi:hypothetical protein